MYDNSPYKKDNSIGSLKSSLDKLTSQITSKSQSNKILLDNTMAKIKADLNNIKNKNRFNKTNYETIESRILDVTG